MRTIRGMIRLAAASLSLCLSLYLSLYVSSAFAAATVSTAVGDVKVAAGAQPARALAKGQAVEAGAVISTGRTGRAILRFDDGQTVALYGDTSFRIDGYRYDARNPESGNALFSLVRGALRAVSGLLAKRNPAAVAFRAPQATIGIRGTDFMIMSVNPLYVQVIEGEISAANGAGTAGWGAGGTGIVESSTTLGHSIPASQLPGGVAGAFSELSGIQLAAGAPGGASSGAAGGAAGAGVGAGTGTAIAIGAGVAAAAAIGGGGGGTTSHHSATTHRAL